MYVWQSVIIFALEDQCFAFIAIHYLHVGASRMVSQLSGQGYDAGRGLNLLTAEFTVSVVVHCVLHLSSCGRCSSFVLSSSLVFCIRS